MGECENEHSHSPNELPLWELQRAIAKGKTLHLEEFFISLESY
jgi:hypothetical protein